MDINDLISFSQRNPDSDIAQELNSVVSEYQNYAGAGENEKPFSIGSLGVPLSIPLTPSATVAYRDPSLLGAVSSSANTAQAMYNKGILDPKVTLAIGGLSGGEIKPTIGQQIIGLPTVLKNNVSYLGKTISDKLKSAGSWGMRTPSPERGGLSAVQKAGLKLFKLGQSAEDNPYKTGGITLGAGAAAVGGLGALGKHIYTKHQMKKYGVSNKHELKIAKEKEKLHKKAKNMSYVGSYEDICNKALNFSRKGSVDRDDNDVDTSESNGYRFGSNTADVNDMMDKVNTFVHKVNPTAQPVESPKDKYSFSSFSQRFTNAAIPLARSMGYIK
jgi:hypothetical protein